MAWSPEPNPGYIRGRRALSPLHHLCFPKPTVDQKSEVFHVLIFKGEAVAYCSIKHVGIHLIFLPCAHETKTNRGIVSWGIILEES